MVVADRICDFLRFLWRFSTKCRIIPIFFSTECRKILGGAGYLSLR